MTTKTRKPARRTNDGNKMLTAVKKHPVLTAGVAAGAVLGVVLLQKAANTAAKVITIKAGAKAATDIAGAVRKQGGRRGKPAGGVIARLVRRAKSG